MITRTHRQRPSFAPGRTGHPGPAARPMITWPLPAGAWPIGRLTNSLPCNGGSRTSARPMITRATPPPARAFRSKPGCRRATRRARGPRAVMHTPQLPAGACLIGQLENPLLRNGHPALSARPMITRHPPATPLACPWPHRASGPGRTPHDHLAAPAGAWPIGRLTNSLPCNGGSRTSARPMITWPLLHQHAPFGRSPGAAAQRGELADRTPSCTPRSSPLARA